MLVQRNLSEKLDKLLSLYPIVFVLGPRQCGKTTFVRTRLPNYEYLDLERPSDEMKVRSEPELFFEANKRPLILDEAQRAPEIFPVLRSVVDRRKEVGKYVILGSASPDLVRDASESLAGRVGFLDMNVFALSEVYGRVSNSFEKHWLKGGFPDAFLTESDLLSFDWFENYTRSLIERDLPSLGVELDSIQFRRLWSMLALSHGEILNMNRLASAMGISPHTVDRYIGILERSFLLRRLPPYFRNMRKRLVKSPKVYLRDSGLFHYFLRVLTLEKLSVSPHRGASFEGYAIEQIARAIQLISPHIDINFFRTADGTEVDLLLSSGEAVFPIEIKSKLSPGKEDIAGLLKAKSLLGFDRALVFGMGDSRYPLADGIDCLGMGAWAKEGFPPFWSAAFATPPEKRKIHSWRMCPAGEHWVRAHRLRVSPSKSDPSGSVTTRHAHCARNPSGKDQLYPEEIQVISDKNFSGLEGKPCPSSLKFKNGSEYDDLIAGWTKYWNDILWKGEALDPNLVKALIASESGFIPGRLARKKDSNSARGLMQITNATRKLLGDESGELKNHFVTATKTELNDPNVNICAGVRWLFRKRDLASVRLKREATWIEAAEEYKGDLSGLLKKNKKSQKDVAPFLKYLEELQECGD